MTRDKKPIIKPKPLLPGGTIGIFAPSSRTEPERVERAVQWLENYGFKVVIHPQTFAVYDQSAGTPSEKIEAFTDLWFDPSIHALMAARGGNRSSLILPALHDMDLASNPKILIGYSDVTALLNAITYRHNIVTFHGPALNSFINDTDEKHLEAAFYMMAGHDTRIATRGGRVVVSGTATGRLVGGNLSLIASMIGTPWAPDFDGAILFLEDTGDDMSRYDRMLIQLRHAGVFERVNAVMFGHFSAAEDHSRRPFTLSIAQLIEEHIAPYGKPVVANMPFGHDRDLITLPIGMEARLSAEGEFGVTLTLAERAVQ